MHFLFSMCLFCSYVHVSKKRLHPQDMHVSQHVIPGQDQGSNQAPSRMQQLIKTEEQKNIRMQMMLIRQYVHEQAPFRTATCPSYKQVLLLQSSSFLKKDTRESYIFCS